ncbi:retrovirus-related pol polyprotein from transposon TNT 1-94 [Tanacetum coccineum]
MPLALKTQNDSFAFVHELKQEMHADLKYVESLEDEIDELESDKAEFSNMYDMFVKNVECDCLAQKLSEQLNLMLYKRTSKAWKWWITQQCPSAYTWVPKTKKKWVPKVRNESVTKTVSFAIDNIVQLILFIVDSGCTKHMTGNLSLLCNFVEKYLGGLLRLKVSGNDLLTGNRGTDLYTISLQETTSSTPICLMAKASPTQAWLWHRRLSHLNFDYINLLSKKDVVIGLPKLKYVKDQLCSSCEVSKAKQSSFKSKILFQSSKGRLNLLYMDLCDPMRVASINGKKYILKMELSINFPLETMNRTALSKDETALSLRLIERCFRLLNFLYSFGLRQLQPHAILKTDQSSSQLMRKRHITLIMTRKSSLNTLYHLLVARGNLTEMVENLDKMKEKGDPCILVGYSTQSKGYRVYNKRTRLIVESIHLRFDEIKEMFETSVANDTSGLVPQRQKVSDYDNPDPALELQIVSPSVDTTFPSQQDLDLLFGPLYDEFFNDGTSRVNKSSSPTDNSIQNDTLPSTHIQPTTEPTIPTNVHAEENTDNQAEFTNPFCTPVQENAESSLRNIVRGNPSKPVQTRRQLATDPEMCMFALTMSIVEPINIKDAMADSAWIEAIQEELHQFDRLQVWELIDKPFWQERNQAKVFVDDKLVNWMSKKQDCTAMSSAEAEYVALSASCAQVIVERTQLQD